MQTETKSSNIILEELENSEGVFMATTKLVSKLDDAFERRLLYKIQFERPDETIRMEILKKSFRKWMRTGY